MKMSFGSHLDGFMAEMIAQGRYRSEEDILRAGLSLLERDEADRFETLRAAIQKGLNSGPAVRVDPEKQLMQFKADRAARRGTNGGL